jgi:DNA-binding Lrp family transcriptional regulator
MTIRSDLSISTKARRVLEWLDEQGGKAQTFHDDIASAIGVSRSTVSKALRELVTAQLIHVNAAVSPKRYTIRPIALEQEEELISPFVPPMHGMTQREIEDRAVMMGECVDLDEETAQDAVDRLRRGVGYAIWTDDKTQEWVVVDDGPYTHESREDESPDWRRAGWDAEQPPQRKATPGTLDAMARKLTTELDVLESAREAAAAAQAAVVAQEARVDAARNRLIGAAQGQSPSTVAYDGVEGYDG